MKRFIRYLYEYQDGKRIRNVGFVKVEQTDESTIVHIHGKGLHLTEDKRLKVYIFYVKEGQCIGLWQGDIDHVNPAVNSRLTFTPEDTGRPSNYPLIEGVILENAGHRRFAAVWDDMPVAVERMQVFRDEPEPDLASLAARKAAQDEEEMRKRSSLRRVERMSRMKIFRMAMSRTQTGLAARTAPWIWRTARKRRSRKRWPRRRRQTFRRKCPGRSARTGPGETRLLDPCAVSRSSAGISLS